MTDRKTLLNPGFLREIMLSNFFFFFLRNGLKRQTELGPYPATIYITLDKLVQLSEPWFPHLLEGDLHLSASHGYYEDLMKEHVLSSAWESQ